MNRRVLIVDDNRSIHDDFRRILAPRPESELEVLDAELFGSRTPSVERLMPGFELTSAYQGADGVELVRAARAANTPFALAIVDMRMPPGFDGIETIQRMWEVDSELQVVICTAFSDATWKDIIASLGVTDRLLILKKPFDLVEVCQLVLALTEKWRLAAQARARVAELAQSRAELAASLALAHSVQEATLDGILVIGTDRRVKTANKRFLDMWQVPASLRASNDDEALLGYALGQLRDPAAFLERVNQLYDRPQDSATDEIALVDGRIFERWTSPMRGASGDIHGRLWCFRDVTERRKLELDRAVVTERMASMGRLAAGVGHEINNPLMYALGNVQTLLDGCARGAVPSRVEIVDGLTDTVDGLTRIRVIVRDLQTLARSDDSDGIVDLETVADRAIQIAANEVKHRATIVRRYQPAPPVCGSATRLGQVVLNLIVNAAQAIPEGRSSTNRIEVAVYGNPTHSIIEVADTGCGIAPEHVEQIFDPFFTTKEVGHGTGLGLAVSREIVMRHGGDITVASTVGVGTRMTVTLPHAPSEPRVVEAVPPPPRKRGRVLVIEDEPAIARVLERGLAAHHEVVVARFAKDALARIESGEAFDVILCDLMMPDVSGMDVYDHLEREHPAILQKVVYMTGGAATPRAQRFLAEVANERIAKPFSTSQLLQVLDRRMATAFA